MTTAQIKTRLDWAMPIIIGAIIGCWPQWIAALSARGGWWTVAGVVLTVVGRAAYKHWMLEPED